MSLAAAVRVASDDVAVYAVVLGARRIKPCPCCTLPMLLAARYCCRLDSAAHEGGVGEAGQRVAAPPTSQPISMGSGELFALEEEVVEQAAEQQTGDAHGSPGSS